MATYNLRFYGTDPQGVIPTGTGSTFVWTGSDTPAGRATVFDTESGIEGLTLDDDNNGSETATADVTIGGLTSTGSDVDAEAVWTVRDTVTGETFQIIEFDVEDGAARSDYTASEQPLVPGRTYEVVNYNSNPDVTAGEPAFSSVDYTSADNVVTGTGGDDTIDASYAGDPDGDQVDSGFGTGASGDGDVIDAQGGDDTIDAGNDADTVYGGGGSDTIDGGAGDDTIHGDRQLDGTEESLNWSAQGGDGANLAAGFTQTTGDIDVSVSFTSDGNNAPTYQVETSDAIYTTSEDPFATNSSLYLFGTGDAATSTTTIDFASNTAGINNEVQDVSFRISDIDAFATNHIDVITVNAYDADGNPVDVTITTDGNDTVSGDTVTAGDTLDSPSDAQGSILVEIAGPVASIEISYSNAETPSGGYTGTHGINVSDIHFETMAVGDADTIDGGTGDDTIYAEDGSDTITFSDGFGNDTVEGGEDSGDTDTDTLDFSALTTAVSGTYADEAGTLGDGSNSVTFSEIEDLILTDQDDTVDASADTAGVSIAGGAGSDTLTGGSGDDTLAGGAGGDIIAGGAGSDTVAGGEGSDTMTVAEGDTATGGDGDDTFLVSDLGEADSTAINITGGEGAETAGDTLDFQGLIGFGDVTYTNTDDASGGLSGFATLADGSTVTFSEIETVIICYAAGSRILTPQGARPVESLSPGDLVLTADNGLQPIRWIAARSVPATGSLAPIRIRAGHLGNDRDLLVSPQHRMLVDGWRAELLFGEREVLVPATHLLDDHAVTRAVGGMVTYYHIAFDQHEVIFAEGARSESFHPGHVGIDGILDPAREEFFRIFPELRADLAAYGDTTRRCLKKHEAYALRAL